jgi:cell division protein FtsA
VLTGGGAQLKHIKHLFEQTTGMDVRLGFPNEHLGKGADLVKSPIYATGVGLTIMGFQKIDKEAGRMKPVVENENHHTPVQPTRKEGSFFEKLMKKSAEWLNEETDKSI